MTCGPVHRHRCQAGAGYPDRLDKVILVGGSTRIPMVSRMLSGELNIEPEIGIDPDLCVALGAGILDQAREKLPLALKRSGEADSLYRYAGFLAGWQSGWDMPER